MSSSNPPNPDTPPVFNNDAFNQGANPTIDTAYLNANYLRFPTAQGSETLQNIQVLGSASFTNAQLPTSLGTIPASTDSSTKIPTTAWVQSAITGGSSNTLTDVLIAGNSAGSQPINMNNQNISAVNTLSFATTSQTSAYTGGAAGTYTDTNMTIDSNGKITAISSGTAASSVLTGTIIAFAGATVPVGYVKCDATPLQTATYPNLFGVLGYTYGGSGGTFYAPNLLNKFIQGSVSSANVGTTGDFTISNNNISATSVSSTAVGQTPIVFNSPSGIGNWNYIKGIPSGDGSQNYWCPLNNSSSSNGSNLVDAFTTPIGVSTPTPLIGTVPSLLMMYIIKT